MSINAIGSNIPIEVAKFGGTGNATLTAGGVLYGNNTGPLGVTSVGTATQILTAHGPGLPPTFENGPGIGGDLVFVATIPIPAPTTFTAFTTGFSTDYCNYMFVVRRNGAGGYSVGGMLALQFSTNGGATYISNAGSSHYRNRVWLYRGPGGAFNDWISINVIGFTTEPGGLPLAWTAMDNSSGIFILRGMMRNGYPTLTGDCTGTGPGGSSFLPFYIGGEYRSDINPPITPNAFRLYSQGINYSGTVTIYKIRTS